MGNPETRCQEKRVAETQARYLAAAYSWHNRRAQSSASHGQNDAACFRSAPTGVSLRR